MIRDGIEESCTLEGLDPDYFPSHSLRKVATTHMTSLRVPKAAGRDRENYAQGSDVMSLTYDYSFGGHEPLAGNPLVSENKLVKKIASGKHTDGFDLLFSFFSWGEFRQGTPQDR